MKKSHRNNQINLKIKKNKHENMKIKTIRNEGTQKHEKINTKMKT